MVNRKGEWRCRKKEGKTNSQIRNTFCLEREEERGDEKEQFAVRKEKDEKRS
jgi:hypothetical protein